MARRNLALIAAAVAVVVLILLGSKVVQANESGRTAAEPTAVSTTSAPVTPSTTAPPPPATAPPGADYEPGETPYPPPPPAELSGPAGQVAYAFVLAYNTFSPTSPSSGTIWVQSWADYATDQVRSQGEAAAFRLWAFTWQTNVSVIYPQVSAVREVSLGDDASIWELTVTRTLFPVGGTTADPGVSETVRWSITVTATSTPSPLVSGCILLTAQPQPEDA